MERNYLGRAVGNALFSGASAVGGLTGMAFAFGGMINEIATHQNFYKAGFYIGLQLMSFSAGTINTVFQVENFGRNMEEHKIQKNKLENINPLT